MVISIPLSFSSGKSYHVGGLYVRCWNRHNSLDTWLLLLFEVSTEIDWSAMTPYNKSAAIG